LMIQAVQPPRFDLALLSAIWSLGRVLVRTLSKRFKFS
jgi:hypothetical protein